MANRRAKSGHWTSSHISPKLPGVKCTETSRDFSQPSVSACTDSNVFYWTQVGGKLRERRREWERERAMGWEFSFSFFFMTLIWRAAARSLSLCPLHLCYPQCPLAPSLQMNSKPCSEAHVLPDNRVRWSEKQKGTMVKRRMRKSNCHETERNAPFTPTLALFTIHIQLWGCMNRE